MRTASNLSPRLYKEFDEKIGSIRCKPKIILNVGLLQLQRDRKLPTTNFAFINTNVRATYSNRVTAALTQNRMPFNVVIKFFLILHPFLSK